MITIILEHKKGEFWVVCPHELRTIDVDVILMLIDDDEKHKFYVDQLRLYEPEIYQKIMPFL
jgi:hypothetical protein